MGVTIEDVAVRTKLNKGSVSRILNGKGNSYSAQTKKRVLETAAEMGYQANALSRALFTGKTNTIALWMHPEPEYSPYFGYLQFCAQRLVDQSGYKLTTETFSPDIAQKPPAVYWPVDGIIVSQLTSRGYNYLHSVVPTSSPIVALQQSHFQHAMAYPNTDTIDVDLYDGGKQAVEHLLDLGCERVAFVVPPYMLDRMVDGTLFDPRGRAYFDVMAQAGKAPQCVSVEHDTRTAGTEGLKSYIESNGLPDGLFCANDEVAIGCYLALHELGIRVPDDVAIVGFDGLYNARLFPCPISSVVVPIKEMCELAWDLLMLRMNNPDTPVQHKVLPSRLEIRASSRR